MNGTCMNESKSQPIPPHLLGTDALANKQHRAGVAKTATVADYFIRPKIHHFGRNCHLHIF